MSILAHQLVLQSPSDRFWSSVKLLVAFRGVNGSTTFVDKSIAPHTMTAVGNAQILNNLLELDGTGDWVTSADSADWPLTGNFCWEWFNVEFDVLTTLQCLTSHYDAFAPAANNRGWAVFLNGAVAPKKLLVNASTLGTSASTTSPINADWAPVAVTPYDFCLERSGTTIRFYIDGVMLASATYASTTFNSNSPLAIGSDNTQSGTTNANELNGRLGVIRYTAAARYASDAGYVVPSLPLPVG